MTRNGYDPDEKVLQAGFDGADLVWDLSGSDNSWDQPGASMLPYTLPGREWSDVRRRLNHRMWKMAVALL